MIDAVKARPFPANGQKAAATAPQQAAEVVFVEDERTKADRAALDQVDRAIAEMRRGRKADARADLDRIKREMDLLRLLGGLDPKKLARDLVRLSRELGKAASQYASAAGVKEPSGGTNSQAPDGVAAEQVHAYGKNQIAADALQADAEFAGQVRDLCDRANALLAELRRRAAQHRPRRSREEGEWDMLNRQIGQLSSGAEGALLDAPAPTSLQTSLDV
ncbi:MAG TPA: hypothetical protein VL974_13585 [Magnetospirillum sp.]|nr:hypothetical protein [Magnetospirillum sp.]